MEEVTKPKFAYRPHSFLQSCSRWCGGYITAVARIGKRIGKRIGVLEGEMEDGWSRLMRRCESSILMHFDAF